MNTQTIYDYNLEQAYYEPTVIGECPYCKENVFEDDDYIELSDLKLTVVYHNDCYNMRQDSLQDEKPTVEEFVEEIFENISKK